MARSRSTCRGSRFLNSWVNHRCAVESTSQPVPSVRTRAARSIRGETNSARNLYLLNRILFKYEFDEDVKDVFNMRPYYEQVTVAALCDAAREYLNTDRYVAVTLVPEK